MDIIKYQTVAGQSFLSGSITKDDRRFRIQNTMVEEFENYAALLERSGYVKLAEKEISAGSDEPLEKNLFYAYANEDTRAFLFWDASIRASFITFEPASPTPPYERTVAKETNDLSPTVTQLRTRGGMSYVIRLVSGEFILIDGGVKDAEDEARLYDFLKENSDSEKPCVALWIFTHSHDDHIGLATEFIARYSSLVDVKAFAYQFPDCDKIEVAMESASEMKREIEELETAIKNFYPQAKIYVPHTGQSYFYAGLEIEVLYGLDDTYPYPYLSFNDTSTAFRFKFENGKTVLFLADSMLEACRRMAHTYGDYLKSDILQVTHHGLIGGEKTLYKLVDPEICLWSSSEERFSGIEPKQKYRWCLGEGGCAYNAYLRDSTIRERRHYSHGRTTTIDATTGETLNK